MASHTRNRVAMATRLADFLERHSIDVLEAATDDDWARIADLAGEQRVPSESSTRACVFIALRERPLDASLLEGLPR